MIKIKTKGITNTIDGSSPGSVVKKSNSNIRLLTPIILIPLVDDLIDPIPHLPSVKLKIIWRVQWTGYCEEAAAETRQGQSTCLVEQRGMSAIWRTEAYLDDTLSLLRRSSFGCEGRA